MNKICKFFVTGFLPQWQVSYKACQAMHVLSIFQYSPAVVHFDLKQIEPMSKKRQPTC